MSDKEKFEHLISASAVHKNTIEELWKWYDFSGKKGVASF